MLKKLKNFIFRVLYALPYSLKATDSEIFAQKDSSNGNNIAIQQQIKNNNIGEALLQGEVTQEVEELRYSTYKVAKEANKYDYLGEGVAIKQKNKNKPTLLSFKNNIICEGVGHELNRVGDYGVNRYVLKIKYKDIPRFKLEKYCNNVKVDLKEKKLILYFEKNTNVPEIRMFYNELERILCGLRSEITEYMTSISFITDDTFTKYTLKNIDYLSIIDEKFQYVVFYTFKEYEEDDFVERFYSETQDEKYKNKERKTNIIKMDNTTRQCYCSMCGKEVNEYDNDITTKTFGYPLCQECLMKIKDIQAKNLR